MVEIIGAPTLDDGLLALSQRAAENEARGRKTLIFCEDRLTLLAERAVLSRGGTLDTEVTTFARFLSGSGETLSKYGSVMAVSSILTERQEELHCFPPASARAVYETIAQLLSSRVDGETLRLCAEEAEGMLALKLKDLALVMAEYRAFLEKTHKLDENGYLALLPEKISEELTETDVIYFAFPSFTRQALEGVRAAMLSARSVTGIFLAGRTPLYTNEGARAFRRLAEEVGEARSLQLKGSLSGEAKRLSEALFSPAVPAGGAVSSEKLFVFRAADEEEEIYTVCALIRKYVAEEGLRFRDFAVLVPNADRFPLCEQVFSAFHIPLFADRRRPFSEHPLSSFLLSLLKAVSDGGLPDSVDTVLSSVYFGESDEYRNYLLRFGAYRGGVYRAVKEGEAVKRFHPEVLKACHERAVTLLRSLRRTDNGRGYAEALRKVCEAVGAQAVTEAMQEELTGSEREFLEIAPLFNVLSELEEVVGDRRFSAREFASVLENGLSALEIAMIPQSADAVFVGDVTESKLARVPVLFAVGLTDELPRAVEDTAVISDRDMEKLSGLRVQVEPAIAVVNARARESMALNLCAFESRLFLGCPVRVNGEEVRPSEVLLYARRSIFPHTMPEVFPYDCCERAPAARALLKYRDGFQNGSEQDAEKFFSLLAAFGAAGEGEFASSLLNDGEKPNVPEAEKLYFGGEISPTLLEGYFACPYAGFASRALRLREREERAMQDTDAGTFVHTVLEETAKKFPIFTTEEECRASAKACAETLLSSPRFVSLCDTDAGTYAGGRLIGESVEACAAAFRQLMLSGFRVRETEGKIVLPELGLAGRTDRVDEAGEYVRVVDYKTGSIDDRPVSYYTGRKLQLQLYLLGASEGKKPAGAFYFPAADSVTAEGEEKYAMKGFFSREDEVLSLMDTARREGEKSAFFEGGGRTEKGMGQADFKDFLRYSLLVSARAESEMRRGNIAPSPYEDACGYCKFKGLCGFAGTPRREGRITCAQIASIAKKEEE